ncbi:MAG TPA: sugar phosphate nucleotidyltransferase, partial [Candidatus Absconditabacterales bacterium]|nr:sugar phosphate nucleotidyltransferase [Candidatus Absconditabacterales bacterium]
MQIVILAGGLGTRLRPITETIPKPMVEVNNKPFLEYQILMLKKYGFKKILMLIGYKGEMIENYFQDGEKYGVKIEYSYEGDELLGTGGAIRNAYSKLEDNFIVINGDTYLDYDYHHMIDLYQKSDLAGYFTVLNNVKYDKSNPNLNNNLRVENGLVKDYIKGINDPKFKYSDSGVYL